MVRKLQQYLDDEKRRQADERNLVSRTELRREQQRTEAEWLAIAQRLVDLKPRQLAMLELAEPQLEVIRELRVIDSAPARQRALKQLRALLRGPDLAEFSQRLEALSDPTRPRPLDPVTQWRNRLVAETGNQAASEITSATVSENANETASAMEAFLHQYPQVDRTQLRILIRNCVRAKETERSRALGRLTRFLSETITTSAHRAVDSADERNNAV